MNTLSRVLFLLTAIAAAYEVVVGIDHYGQISIVYFTLGFGIIMLASLLILLIGYDVLENPLVIVVATLLPVSFALGLVNEYASTWHRPFLIFAILSILLIILLKFTSLTKWGTLPIIAVHGVSGLIIFIVPFYLAFKGYKTTPFIFVGIGGLFMGLTGMLLSMLKVGKPVLSRERILSLFPYILLLTTLLFGIGLNFG